MADHPNRFPKSHRLYLKKEIDLLFASGKQIRSHPVNVVFAFYPVQDFPVKMAVSVPKKIIRQAVDRNRIKRQIREAFRLHRLHAVTYCGEKKIELRVMFIYTGKVSPDYAVIESKIILILQRLVKEHEMAAV